MRSVIVFLLSCILAQTAFAAKHFIIDTDAASDDVIAILYLLQRPDIKIDAISIVGNGEVPCAPALRNLHGILQLMQQPTIPLACGGEEMLNGQHRFPAALIHEQASLSGMAVFLPKPAVSVSSLSAVGLLIHTLKQAKESVTVLTLGPLTNLAAAFKKDPTIKNHIQEIFIMGGAVFVPGNIRALLPNSTNAVAEWNIYVDPAAAKFVLQQAVPMTLISLDITNQVPLKMAFYRKLEKIQQTDALKFTYAILKGNLQGIRSGNFYFWDPLAAVIASDASIAHFNYQPLKVSIAPELQSGRTVLDKTQGHPIRIVTSIDKKRFETLLLNGMQA